MTQLSLFDDPPPRPKTGSQDRKLPRPTTLPGRPPRPKQSRGRAPIVLEEDYSWKCCREALAEGRGGELAEREDRFSPGHKVTCVAYDGTMGVVDRKFPSGCLEVVFGRTHLLYWPDGVLQGRWASNEDHNLTHL